MKNLIFFLLFASLSIQYGYSTNPVTANNNEINNISYEMVTNDGDGFIDKLTNKINAGITKAKITIKKAISFIKNKSGGGLGLWTLLTLGIGLLATVLGVVLLFAGLGTGSGGAFILGYLLFYGGILLLSAGFTLGIIWLVLEFA